MDILKSAGAEDGASAEVKGRKYCWHLTLQVWLPEHPKPFELAVGIDHQMWSWLPSVSGWVLLEQIGTSPDPGGSSSPVILRVALESRNGPTEL